MWERACLAELLLLQGLAGQARVGNGLRVGGAGVAQDQR
jgi:hypothetical protein